MTKAFHEKYGQLRVLFGTGNEILIGDKRYMLVDCGEMLYKDWYVAVMTKDYEYIDGLSIHKACKLLCN